MIDPKVLATSISWQSVNIPRQGTDEEQPRILCFYCNGIVQGKYAKDPHVGDHFPIPKARGGECVVPCCTSCHSMKDLYLLDRWPIEWIMKVIEDFPKLNRETKIFLAKAMRVFQESLDKKVP